MTIPNTGWSDAARAAALEARRRKAGEKVAAYEADYQRRHAEMLATIRQTLDRQRGKVFTPPPGPTSSADDRTRARLSSIMDTLRRQRARIKQTPALTNTGWTDEARAASLAVRRQKIAARKAGTAAPSKATRFTASQDSEDDDWYGKRYGDETAEERARRVAREATRKRRRDKERQAMFQRQRDIAGEDFVDNWYPQGYDGANENPFFGTSTPAAPYGHYEGTTIRRIEPLYDSSGTPIIPRQKPPPKRPPPINADPLVPIEQLKYLVTKAPTTSLDDQLTYIAKVDQARKLWGPFGKKYRFMMANPGATEADWEAKDAKYLAKRARTKPHPEEAEPDPNDPWRRVPKGAYTWQSPPRYAPGQSAPELRDPRTGKTQKVEDLPPRKPKTERPHP